jgi:hypothetical protein
LVEEEVEMGIGDVFCNLDVPISLSLLLSADSPSLLLFLTFARLADDSLRLGLGGEQALDAVCSGADLHVF